MNFVFLPSLFFVLLANGDLYDESARERYCRAGGFLQDGANRFELRLVVSEKSRPTSIRVSRYSSVLAGRRGGLPWRKMWPPTSSTKCKKPESIWCSGCRDMGVLVVCDSRLFTFLDLKKKKKKKMVSCNPLGRFPIYFWTFWKGLRVAVMMLAWKRCSSIRVEDKGGGGPLDSPRSPRLLFNHW